MMSNSLRRNSSLVAALTTVSSVSLMSAASAEDNKVTPIYDFRMRYEAASSDVANNDAEALTGRARVGVNVKLSERFMGLIEGEAVGAFKESYNSLTNGKTDFAVIADPEGVELNRAQISYLAGDGTTITVGRQKLVFDDQRFIGAVDFRQNQQTFDAIQIVHKPTDEASLKYAYISKAHRILGDDHPAGEFESDSHAMSLGVKFGDFGKLSAHAYLLDFDNAAAASSATFGFKVDGQRPLSEGSETKLAYTGAYSVQSDYGDNPNSYDTDYWLLQLGAKKGPSSAFVGVEQLGSDDGNSFSTPLATLHKFQGYADVFLNTPANGLVDRYVGASTVLPVKDKHKVKVKLMYHDFETAEGGTDLGNELDAVAAMKLSDKISLEGKAAIFEGTVAGPADTSRLWMSLRYKSN